MHWYYFMCAKRANPDKAKLKNTIGPNLTRLIKNCDYNAKELAKIIDVDYRNFSRWKSSKASDPIPPSEHLPKLCKLLNCSIDDIFDFDTQFTPQTEGERELLMVARNANPNLPRRQIINALSLSLGRMQPEQRKVWLHLGNLLADIKQ